MGVVSYYLYRYMGTRTSSVKASGVLLFGRFNTDDTRSFQSSMAEQKEKIGGLPIINESVRIHLVFRWIEVHYVTHAVPTYIINYIIAKF